MLMKNIIIGTAGWRMKYGNSLSILSTKEITALINHLKSYKIFSYDTATSYGDVEEILFSKLEKNTQIDTKLKSFDDINEFKKNLKDKLKFPIRTLYFHDPKIFKRFPSKEVQTFVKTINDEGFNAGFSIYDKEDILDNLQFFEMEENKVQLPVHLFDLTVLNKVLMAKIKAENVNLRSFFARGLLFLSSEKFKKALGEEYYEIKNGFEELYKMPLTPKNAQNLTYGLINYLTSNNFRCIIGLNSIREVNFFIKQSNAAKNQNINWKKIIASSNKLIDIQEINL